MKALLIVMMVAGPAQACPEAIDGPGARESYQAGERAYASGRYDDALTAFTLALERSGRAELYFNLANTHERMGDRARAADALELYLECAPPPDADLVRERTRRLRDTAVVPIAPTPICTERDEPTARILTAATEDELDDPGPRSRPRAAPWLIAGGASLALAATLALASTSAAPDAACDGCRTSGDRDWRPVLEGGAALAATAGLLTTTIGVATVIRF